MQQFTMCYVQEINYDLCQIIQNVALLHNKVKSYYIIT